MRIAIEARTNRRTFLVGAAIACAATFGSFAILRATPWEACLTMGRVTMPSGPPGTDPDYPCVLTVGH